MERFGSVIEKKPLQLLSGNRRFSIVFSLKTLTILRPIKEFSITWKKRFSPSFQFEKGSPVCTLHGILFYFKMLKTEIFRIPQFYLKHHKCHTGLFSIYELKRGIYSSSGYIVRKTIWKKFEQQNPRGILFMETNFFGENAITFFSNFFTNSFSRNWKFLDWKNW